VYPEAVYLHQGDSYIVRELDLAARLARVERLDALLHAARAGR